ncbi:hypothetical protein CPB85DRAFT_1529579 [Mucidula mucida]|nr:hypothetical protein CPB85DRAFT_1529579 [Mucidula mucida]
MSGLSREALLSIIANFPTPVKPSIPVLEPVNTACPMPKPEDVPRTGNLKAEFEKAMGGDFDFKGSFAYSGTFPQAPNPVLFVEGVGLIALPLSERDAQLLINASARAPYGHNDQTIINPQVRDTWEIEPAKIVFKNPAWAKFVQSQVLSAVTKGNWEPARSRRRVASCTTFYCTKKALISTDIRTRPSHPECSQRSSSSCLQCIPVAKCMCHIHRPTKCSTLRLSRCSLLWLSHGTQMFFTKSNP